MQTLKFPITEPFDFNGQRIDGFVLKKTKTKQRHDIAALLDDLPEGKNLKASMEFDDACLAIITGQPTLIFQELEDEDYEALKVAAAPFMPRGWDYLLNPSEKKSD